MNKSVLFLCNKDIKNPAGGGGTYVIHRLMKALVKKGYSVSLICSRFPGAAKFEVIDGIEIWRTGGRYSLYPFSLFEYFRLRKRRRFDLIVDCALLGIPFFTPLYVDWSSIIAVFFHLEKDVFRIELAKEIGRIKGRLVGEIANAVENKLVPQLYKKVTKITFSVSTKEDMLASGFNEENIIVLHEGIELRKYGVANETKSSVPLILYLGRLKRYKGIQDAIRAFDIVQREIPNIRFSIIGRGDYFNHLLDLVKELKLEQKVTFHGYVSEKEKIKMLRKAHLLVHPSYKEGWATPVIEANACATPAVGSDAIGVRETIIHGKTGYIYPMGNYKEMAKYIKIILNNPKLRMVLSANAMKWARNFDWSQTEERFKAVVQQLITSK